MKADDLELQIVRHECDCCKPEQSPDERTDTKQKRITYLENRIRAIYHNCHSQASFLAADATEMDSEKETMLREAGAYKIVAGWLKAIIPITE